MFVHGLLLLVKDTKFESKSQPPSTSSPILMDCFYWSKIQNLKANHNSLVCYQTPRMIAFIGQRYKIWKQITTHPQHTYYLCNCFYWSKIQNLKANHNWFRRGWLGRIIAFIGQRYKIWKQITTDRCFFDLQSQLLLLVKDTKFESKSQPASMRW